MTNTNHTCSILQTLKTYTVAEPVSFWAMVQAIGIIVTLFFIWRQLKIQSTTNVIAALSEIAKEWWSPELTSARKEVCKGFRDEEAIGNQSAERVCGFFENLGLYHRKKIISTHLAWELYSYYCEHYWPMLEPTISDMRKSDSTIYTAFENLHKDMKKYSKKQKAPCDAKPREVLVEFAKAELSKK